MYTIVQFEDGILAVPNGWVDEEKKTCRYPRNRNAVKRAIIDSEDAQDDWSTLPIMRLFGKASEFRHNLYT